MLLLFFEKSFGELQSRKVTCYNVCSSAVLVGGPLPRGHEFELHDARFHWGRENQRGSEHTVNFKAFPMEVSLCCIASVFVLKIINHCLKTIGFILTPAAQRFLAKFKEWNWKYAAGI